MKGEEMANPMKIYGKEVMNNNEKRIIDFCFHNFKHNEIHKNSLMMESRIEKAHYLCGNNIKPTKKTTKWCWGLKRYGRISNMQEWKRVNDPHPSIRLLTLLD